jgi:glyoxylase-like metal-dependent hydrolase (beta-lactamase superfamily II)
LTRYLEDHDIVISHVLLTHWHGDHTGGVADVLTHNPSTKVYKHSPAGNQNPIENGQVFQTQGATLRAVLTPGHTTDHTCFLLEEENALFTGDNVLGHGYSVAEDLGSYIVSLRLIGSLGCRVGYPGHGAVIRDLPRKITNYIAQRDIREKQVYESLLLDKTQDGLSIADLSLLLYGDLARDTATFESALKPLLGQVLLMLVEHGKVGTKLVGRSKTRYWFARTQSHGSSNLCDRIERPIDCGSI